LFALLWGCLFTAVVSGTCARLQALFGLQKIQLPQELSRKLSLGATATFTKSAASKYLLKLTMYMLDMS
jgi:hypothetical protein